MAAKKTPKLAGRSDMPLGRRMDENARLKIKTVALVNRLQTHALAKTDLMSASQIQAAKILLAKTLPDLQSVEFTGDKSPLGVEVVLRPLGGDAAGN
jgi:hypothetical protein